jgi:hypothetical protein
MNYTPKNILKGRTSKGETFTIREWTFEELATIETSVFFILLILGLVVGSFAAPVLTLFALIGFSGRFQFTQLLAILTGVYFLIDCYYGSIALAALKIFFEESTIDLLLLFNGASVVISTILMFFGSFISDWITKPINHYDDSTYNALPNSKKIKYEKEIASRKTKFIVIMVILFFVSAITVDSVIERDKGWSEHGITVSPSSEEIQ